MESKISALIEKWRFDKTMTPEAIAKEILKELDQEWISVEDGDIKDGEYLCKFIGWDDMEFYRVLEYHSNSEEWDDWNGVRHRNVTHYQEIKPPNTQH